MVQLIINGSKCRLDIAKVHYPAGLLSQRPLNSDPHLKGMTVETRAFVPLGHIGQSMGGLYTKIFINLHFCFKNP